MTIIIKKSSLLNVNTQKTLKQHGKMRESLITYKRKRRKQKYYQVLATFDAELGNFDCDEVFQERKSFCQDKFSNGLRLDHL